MNKIFGAQANLKAVFNALIMYKIHKHNPKMAYLPLSVPFIIFSLFSSAFILPSSHQSLITTPITKDNSTNLYTLLIYLKTPLQPSKLHLDLGSYLPWYDCSRHYKSSSSNPVLSNSTLCTDIDPKIFTNCFEPARPGCSNDSCAFFPENPVTRKIATGQLITDKFALPTTGKPGPVSDLVFSCTDKRNRISGIYKGLAKGTTGLAAMGRFNYSLPSQISRAASSPLVFSICLPGSSNKPGLAVFNSPGPYYFSPGVNVSKSLIYTDLKVGPQGADTQIFYFYKSPDYYLGLTSLKVHDKVVPLNKTLLGIDEIGRGGVKLSSSVPYSVLQTSIFKALVDAFVRESAAMNLTVIAAVEPFSVCYAADEIASTGLGPRVPTIDLVLENEGVVWRVYGSNSMVRVQGSNGVDAWCLGFVDGGVNPRTSIVIGGHQLGDNLLQFDLDRGRLGFSSSLLFYGTSCANFDYNST